MQMKSIDFELVGTQIKSSKIEVEIEIDSKEPQRLTKRGRAES